ncbi:MAG: DNA-3-methyladenine glycosylase, partial [Nitriliruptoraceae bacterium]
MQAHHVLLDRPRALERARLTGTAPDAARALLGALIQRELEDGTILARIVEVEAYDEDDPASHSAAGRTRRNGAMFERAGTAYVYRAYGIHWCLNCSAGGTGEGSAVLVRAAVVVAGRRAVERHRPTGTPRTALLRGPGCLTTGLAVSAEHDRVDLLAERGPLLLRDDGWRPPLGAIANGPRVGVSRAQDRP